MRATFKAAALAALVVCLSPIAYGANISGTVKGPDGKPFKGAFVEAQDMDSRIATVVLSDKDGHYRIENLPEGEFRLMVRAVGYRFEPRAGIQLVAKQSAAYDIALEKGAVHWTDLSIYQGEQLLPQDRGKDKLASACFRCHGFQSRMAAQVRDESGHAGTSCGRSRRGPRCSCSLASMMLSALTSPWMMPRR